MRGQRHLRFDAGAFALARVDAQPPAERLDPLTHAVEAVTRSDRAAADGEAAWRELQRLKPDLLVTDIEMPGLTGLELAQRIQRHELPTKVVIVTTFARAGFLRRALDAGVSGYLLKDAPAEDLAEALRKVHRGGKAIDPQLALEAWSEADPLNDRERQALRLAGEGLSAGEIATQLNLSHGTVRNYLSEAIGKLGVGNRIEAYRLARQKGWL
jgi:two-component system, NarL family, response regulator DesR